MTTGPSPSQNPLSRCYLANRSVHAPQQGRIDCYCLKSPCSSHGMPPSCPKYNGFSSISHANVPGPDILESPAESRLETTQLKILKQKLEELGMDNEICVPGQHNHLLCPKCKGGDSEEKSLTLFVTEDGGAALWMCFRGKCGRRGRTRVT
nr:twinkle like protein, chloroplastic/mitochondrial [Quercus suber]